MGRDVLQLRVPAGCIVLMPRIGRPVGAAGFLTLLPRARRAGFGRVCCVQAEGLQVERRERFKLGIVERLAARKPAPD